MDFLWSTSTNETNFCLTQFFKLGSKCGDLQTYVMIQFLIELIEKVKVVCCSTKLTFLCSVKQILLDLMKKVEVQKSFVSIITGFI